MVRSVTFLPLGPAAWSRRAGRWALRSAGVALALFHAGLLAGRVTDASIADPEVGRRWGVAALLAALAASFRRQGLPLLHGRSGLVFWLLVLLLHLGATPVPSSGPGPDPLLLAAPLAAALAGVAATVAARLRPAVARARRPGVPTRREDPARRVIPPFAFRFAPRPPPAG